MSDKKTQQVDRMVAYKRMLERHAGRAVRPYRADGYMNLLNRYGTSKDTTEQYKFVPESTIADESLTMFYEGNGLFAKIIDAPAEEAIKHGFTLKDISDEEVETFYTEALDELDWEEAFMTGIKWARLFGGAIGVMLINDGRGLEEPLDWKKIKSIDDIRIYDRSVIQPDYNSMFSYEPEDPFRKRGSRLGMPEHFYVTSRYGNFTVHESRCLTFQNGILPENSTNSIYQFWGMPEYVRIHRALRDAEIAHGSAPKMLDRSVQAVYKMKDLASLLATEQGETQVLRRLQTIDMARGLLNSITIDNEGEDYDFRQFQFSGVSDVIDSTCNFLSALTNIPQTILFGRSPAGMNSTGESDLENWYNFVQRIQKRMIKSNLRYLLSVIFQAGMATEEVKEIPKIKIEFNPLWSMSDAEVAELENKKAQTAQAKAQTAEIYVNMQALDPREVRRKLADSNEFDVDTILDEEDLDDDLVGYVEELEAAQNGGNIFSEGDFSEYAEEKGEGTEGSTPTNAPAATKLPEDMTDEELTDVEENTGATEETVDNPSDEAEIQVNDSHSDSEPSNPSEEAKPFSVGVLVISDGKVLSGTRHNDFGYGLVCGPGGHGEDGETPEQAAFRETEEEFGISPKELIPLGRGPVEPDTGLQPYLFLCTSYDGEPNCVDLEMSGAKFRTLEELDQLAASMFQPFADGLEILKTCIDTALFFGDEEEGVTHEALVKEIGEAVNADGGPGSGNHGHAGVPGAVGGSAPTGSALTGEMSSAIASGDENRVVQTFRSNLKRMPVGSSFTYYGTTTTKIGDDEFESAHPMFGKMKGNSRDLEESFVDTYDEDTVIEYSVPSSEKIAEAKIAAGELNPKETSAVKNSYDLSSAPQGQLIRNEEGVWEKQGDEFMNLETGELLESSKLQTSDFKEMNYTGSTEFEYGGSVRQEVLDNKLWEMNRNQLANGEEANITSDDVEAMVGSVRHYGLGGECQMILSTQDPEPYADLIKARPMSESEHEYYSKEADNIERYIALSDKVDVPIYRGISLNSQFSDPDVMSKTLGQLEEGKVIEMGHIASWSKNKGTAESYSLGAVDAELEGDNYSIVYQVRNNKSAASLAGINPESECLSPKSATYKVGKVTYEWDDELEVHKYLVDLEEE